MKRGASLLFCGLLCCTAPRIDELLPCPCRDGSGYECNPATMLCEPGPLAPCGITGAERATTFSIEDFGAAWTTGNAIRWTWEMGGDTEAVTFEVHVGRSATEVISTPQVFDGDTNPELAFGFLTGTGAADAVRLTTTRGLDGPRIEHFARLIARDGNAVACSDIVTARTAGIGGTFAVLLDEDADQLRFSVPGCFEQRAADDAFSGPTQWSIDIRCNRTIDPDNPDNMADLVSCVEPEMPVATCFQTFQFRVDAGDLETLANNRGAFDAAYVEVALRMQGEPTTWMDFGLLSQLAPRPELDPLPAWATNGDARTFSLGRNSIPTGDYQVIQVPLGALGHRCGSSDIGCENWPLTGPDLLGLQGFLFNAQWTDGTRVDVDGVRLVW